MQSPIVREKGLIVARTDLLNEFECLTLTDRIYEVIKEGIVHQEFKPGERLLDQEIADRLKVSRTPVREAINRLGVEGLVTIIPRRGAFVVDLTLQDIKEIYEVREGLESLAVELAIPLLQDQDIALLHEALTEYAEAMEREEFVRCFELDRKFHDLMIQLSRNSKLVEINRNLGGSIQVSRWRHCRDSAKAELSLHEHQAILEALAKRDGPLASQLVREHIRKVKEDLLKEGLCSEARQ